MPEPTADLIARARGLLDGLEPGPWHPLLVELCDRLEEAEEDLADARAEIARHHADFERWEDMADEGARATRQLNALRKAGLL